MKKPRTYKASLIHLKMVQAGVRNLSMVRTPDRRYVLASSDYILGPFARSLRGWLKRREILDYVPEINDCDDFAQAAQTWARIAHNRTWREQWPMAHPRRPWR